MSQHNQHSPHEHSEKSTEVKPARVQDGSDGSQSEQKPVKNLHRSRNQRVIAGVCGGLGNHFGIDPVWMRILFIILLLCMGATLVVYLIMWLIIPLEP